MQTGRWNANSTAPPCPAQDSKTPKRQPPCKGRLGTLNSQAVLGALQATVTYPYSADKAFEWLDRAYAQRDGGLIFTKVDPLLKSLHNDPRYAAFLKKLNLPI